METLYFEPREVVFETGNLSDCAYLVEEGKFESPGYIMEESRS